MGRSGRDLILRYYPGICRRETEENHESLSYDSQSSVQDLNPRPPEYEAGVLSTLPRRSIKLHQEWTSVLQSIVRFHVLTAASMKFKSLSGCSAV
jgi:hypothetical protein